MEIGIIGAGAIGQAVAQQAVRAGVKVKLANRRGPASLAGIVGQLGPDARAVNVREAAGADIVVLAVGWAHLPDALADPPAWEGRIVIDATNPVVMPGFRVADLGDRTSSEVVAEHVRGARLVKAFNTLATAVLASDPQQAGGKRVLFLSGDDKDANAQVAQFIERLGFASVDLGSLATGGPLQQFPGGPLPILNLIKLA
jgi:8-hydroxy-5-deazaflavin:NADPH oxidoreductase